MFVCVYFHNYIMYRVFNAIESRVKDFQWMQIISIQYGAQTTTLLNTKKDIGMKEGHYLFFDTGIQRSIIDISVWNTITQMVRLHVCTFIFEV